MKMSRIVIILLFISTVLASPFIIDSWINYRLGSVAAISEKTGVNLPVESVVLKIKYELFSFADGKNYEWLISSSTSLLPWIKNIGQREGPGVGGWSHIKTFQEISDFKDPRFNQLGLHSVWRIVNSLPDRKETYYLYIASDETTGILATFRP
jgi:hypothetical protein